jgi:hypothetical protein
MNVAPTVLEDEFLKIRDIEIPREELQDAFRLPS